MGTTALEETIVRTGGASDGVNGFSMKMVSNANCVLFYQSLISDEIVGWTSSTTSKTFTIEAILDSAANLQNNGIYMQFLYPGESGDSMCAAISDRMAPNGTPADKTSSSAAWTTTGMTNPNAFKMHVTVTPGQPGPIKARIFLAAPSTTVYIDPVITES